MLQTVLEEAGKELLLLAEKFGGSSEAERFWYPFTTPALVCKVKSPL